MKKVLLSMFCAAAFAVAAQNTIGVSLINTSVSVAPGQVIYTTTIVNDVTKITFDVKNLSSVNSNTYNVKRYDMVLNVVAPGDSALPNFCFAGNCYGKDVKFSPTPLELAPLQSASYYTAGFFPLDADLIEATAKGYTFVKYTIINANNPSDSVQFSIKYNDPVWLGLKDQAKNVARIEIYPNPAKDFVSFSVSSLQGAARIQVINSIGDIVREKSIGVSENKATLNVQDLPSGVYFVQMKDANSTQTRKLVIE
jgi:hypothetical protein